MLETWNENYSFKDDVEYQSFLGKNAYERFHKSGKQVSTLFDEDFTKLMPYWDDTTRVIVSIEVYNDLLKYLYLDEPEEGDFVSLFWLIYLFQQFYDYDFEDEDLDRVFTVTEEQLKRGIHYYFKIGGILYSAIIRKSLEPPKYLQTGEVQMQLLIRYEEADCFPNYKSVLTKPVVALRPVRFMSERTYEISLGDINKHVIFDLIGKGKL